MIPTHRRASASRGRSNAPSAEEAADILLVYDWECPACDAYCRRVSVQPSAGRLRLVNAREASDVLSEITKAGLDIDEGMVVKIAGQIHYGSDAIHVLALHSSRADLFNSLSHYLFRSKWLSRVLYPGLRACRRFLLKILRKTRINNLGNEGNDRF